MYGHDFKKEEKRNNESGQKQEFKNGNGIEKRTLAKEASLQNECGSLARKTGYSFCGQKVGGFFRFLFLARMQMARDDSVFKQKILGSKNNKKQRARQSGECQIQESGLENFKVLGTRIEAESKHGRCHDSRGFKKVVSFSASFNL